MKTSVKYFRQLWQFCVLLAVMGCSTLKQEDNCPPGAIQTTTTILFSYISEKGNETLTDYITSVDAYIFDSNNMLFEHKFFTESELKNNRVLYGGYNLAAWHVDHLPAGEYYVVAWGNVGSNSIPHDYAQDFVTLDKFLIEIDSRNQRTTSGDRIYYAPKMPNIPSTTNRTAKELEDYRFIVHDDQDDIHVMPFVIAHRTINVYIVGYPCEEPLWVKGTNLAAEYDYYYRTRPEFRDFLHETAEVTTVLGDKALLATFRVGFSDIKSNMNFTLFYDTPDGQEIITVNLLEFITKNPKAFVNNGEVIDILITMCDCLTTVDGEFFDLGVGVTLPAWHTTVVKPGGVQ